MNKYKFYRKETNTTEEVLLEKWCWEAHYNDGAILKQFDDDGNFHQVGEIDQDKLGIFKMVNSENQKTYVLMFDPLTMKLIHRYKRFILNAGTSEQTRITAYIFGYKLRDVGEKFFVIPPQADELIITDSLERVKVV